MKTVTALTRKAEQAALKQRQQEVAAGLAAYGLARGPRRLLRATACAPDEAARAQRLRAALVRLGPVFAACGRYLATRPDLWPVADCLELAAIPDWAPPTPAAAVRDLFVRSFGCAPQEAFYAFETEPCESRLLYQLHRAWLGPEQPVLVKLAHPELAAAGARDLALLPLLQDAFASLGWAEAQSAAVLSDFRRTLDEQRDCLHELAALEKLQREAQTGQLFSVPRPYRHLCSAQVLTLEYLPGRRLDELLAAEPEVGPQRFELQHQLYQGWLRQAFSGGLFPVEPWPENVLILPDGQLAIVGGSFASLTAESSANLFAYLVAAATGSPDRACDRLLAETARSGAALSEAELRSRFRQIVPARDGGWSAQEDSDTLAEHLFVQWRLAGQGGYQPKPPLLAFYRGLFLSALAVRRVAPGRDPLATELEEARLRAVIEQWQQMTGFGQVGDYLERYTALMMSLPGKLDEVLTLVATGNTRVKLQFAESARERRQRNGLALVIALLLVLVAVVILTRYLGAPAGDRIAAVPFVLLGALLLWVVSRAH